MGLTLEMIERGYVDGGLRPERRHALIENNACCAMGAVWYGILKADKANENATPIYDYFDQTFGRSFSLGLRNGLDGDPPEHPKTPEHTAEYGKGYELGSAAAAKLLDNAQ